MSQEELQESFSWHAEEHIPFDIADVNLDYQLSSSSPGLCNRSDGGSARAIKIAKSSRPFQLAGKQPVIIDVDAFALQNCL